MCASHNTTSSLSHYSKSFRLFGLQEVLYTEVSAFICNFKYFFWISYTLFIVKLYIILSFITFTCTLSCESSFSTSSGKCSHLDCEILWNNLWKCSILLFFSYMEVGHRRTVYRGYSICQFPQTTKKEADIADHEKMQVYIRLEEKIEIQ